MRQLPGPEFKIPLERFAAVGFDFDGTLANTIPAHSQARFQGYGLIAKETGDSRFTNIPPELHDLAHQHGSHAGEINAWILYTAGIIDDQDPQDPLVQEVIGSKQTAYMALASMGLDQITNAVPFARQLSERLPGNLGIVTTAHLGEVEPFLGRYQLQEVFPPHNNVLHDDVSRLKPDPEAYVLFAEKLGVAPQDVLVIEDSPRGIHAAKLAGSTVVALTTTHNTRALADTEFRQPDYVTSGYWKLGLALGLPDLFPEDGGIDRGDLQSA